MTHSTIELTVPTDLPDLEVVLDLTELFPSELLANMIAPTLSGDSDALWLTCHLDGRAVGFCYNEPEALTDRTWNMLALAILPDLQGRKLGSALIAATEERLRARGQRMLIVETSGAEIYAKTRRFYSGNGFDEEARIRDFWAAGDDKVIFRKSL